MAFTAETIVADAIRVDPLVVDRLIALNPLFKKLNNPILRKTMARLVTLGEAAKVAGLPVVDILAAANNVTAPSPALATAPPPVDPLPDWFEAIDPTRSVHLDVRPMLARGEEPLGDVMRTAAPIAVGHTLILDAPFDPAPLRRVLAGKGFVSHPAQIDDCHWRITFLRQSREAVSPQTDIPSPRSEGVRSWREGGITHIDVRGLEPPQPMLAILRLVDDPASGPTIVVHHEREPMFLYPELDQRSWSHSIVDGDPDEVRLVLRRPGK